MKILKILAILLISGTIANANEVSEILTDASKECDKVYFLVEGQTSPCMGFLFGRKLEKQIRLKEATYDDLVLYSEKQKELNETLYKQIDIQNQIIIENEKRNELTNIIYAVLGALVAATIVNSKWPQQRKKEKT